MWSPLFFFHSQTRSMNFSRPSPGASCPLFQLALDDVLGRDAGVVGAGDPEGIEALHPFIADEDVLERVVERVPHVEGAGDVGRGDDDGEGSPFPFTSAWKETGVQPALEPFFLDGLRLIDLSQLLVRHSISEYGNDGNVVKI
jgi:hypothetical protein